jgi:hypothetical protein
MTSPGFGASEPPSSVITEDRLHDAATLVAAVLILAWAIYMALAVRDLLRFVRTGVCSPAAICPRRGLFSEEAALPAGPPPRNHCSDEEAREVVRRMALGRTFDLLWEAVRMGQSNRRMVEVRGGLEKQSRQPRWRRATKGQPLAASDERPPSSQSDDHQSPFCLNGVTLRRRVRFRDEIAGEGASLHRGA